MNRLYKYITIGAIIGIGLVALHFYKPKHKPDNIYKPKHRSQIKKTPINHLVHLIKNHPNTYKISSKVPTTDHPIMRFVKYETATEYQYPAHSPKFIYTDIGNNGPDKRDELDVNGSIYIFENGKFKLREGETPQSEKQIKKYTKELQT